MDSVTCVAGFFVFLGLFCILMPAQVAQMGVHLDFIGRARSREILKRYAHWTRWTGRIVGGILVVAGLVMFFASRT